MDFKRCAHCQLGKVPGSYDPLQNKMSIANGWMDGWVSNKDCVSSPWAQRVVFSNRSRINT